MQLIDYLKDVRGELSHVKWPTSKTTTFFTIVVIAVSVVAAIYLGAFDFIFSDTITNLLSN